MTILALSDSLRRDSINSAVLRRAAAAAERDGIDVAVDQSIRLLPHFDPDLEARQPEVVRAFRAACEGAIGVLLAVPEYAFGIPGAFKNALDWTVGSGSLYRKPVTVLSVAPPGRGARVREALDHVFTALDADVVYASVPVANGAIDDALVVDRLRATVRELAIRAGAPSAQPALRRR